MDNNKQAKAVFDSIWKLLEEKGLNHQEYEDRLMVTTKLIGDDLPIDLSVTVNEKNSFIVTMSQIPFTVPEDKRLDVAIALSIINNRLSNGCFVLDYANGKIYFKMIQSFLESLISKKVLEYLLFISCKIIDDYNDKLLVVSKQSMTVDEMIKYLVV